jgi:thiamine pyrophosphate-dependent acetolactate synthase large subunit-like protein
MATMDSTARNGAEILLDCLIRDGVDLVFAYPGGATLPIHQALTRVKHRLRTILPRHEQGGGFAACGYAKSSGKVGVCFATSGPGATNLVSCLADAQREAIPLIAITGQVNRPVIGTDAFQEIPIVAVSRSITKHHYLVDRTEDIPRIAKEAVHLARTGRPGPVLIDVPKDQQARRLLLNDDPPIDLPGYRPTPHKPTHGYAWAAPGMPHPVLKRLWQLLRDHRQLDKAFLTTGSGPAQAWVARSYRFPDPRRWITTTSLGAIGYALPAAIGVQAAHPEQIVIAVDTPASLLSNIQEFGSAYCEKLPVKVLLLHAGEGLTSAEEPLIDFAELARGFRACARRVDCVAELDTGLKEMLDSDGPYLLDIEVPLDSIDTHSARKAIHA